MKRIILGAAVLLCLASCSYKVYPVDALVDNYKLAMQTPEEIAAKENVAVFLSDQEVPGPYKLIAFVENPSPVARDILKKAVLKADELGGNAVIIQSARSFKVIELAGRPVRKAAPGPEVRTQPGPRPEPRVAPAPRRQAPEREPRAEGGSLIDKVKGASIFQKDEARAEARAAREEAAKARAAEAEAARAKAAADRAAREEAARAEAQAAKARAAAEKAAAAQPAPTASPAKSPVFDDSTLQWFTSGYVYRAKEEEQVEIIDAMNAEIRENLKVCKTQAEADFITGKINQLEKYNNTLPIPSGTQASKIKAYRNMLKRLVSKFPSEPQNASGRVDGAVQSVKDFIQNLGNK